MRTVVLLLVVLVSGCYDAEQAAHDRRVEEIRRANEQWFQEYTDRMIDMGKKDPARFMRTYGSGVGDPIREVLRGNEESLDQIMLREEIRRQGEDQARQLRRLEGEVQEMKREQEFRETRRLLERR